MTSTVSRVDEARPKIREMARPSKIGSGRMKAAPIIAATAVSRKTPGKTPDHERRRREPGASRLEIEGGLNRPPFRRSAGVGRLFEAAAGLAGKLGFDLPEVSRGGVSDGNFGAALGRPTLDGLGCGGHGAHAEDEHIRVSTIAPRAALIHDMLVSAEFQNRALGNR